MDGAMTLVTGWNLAPVPFLGLVLTATAYLLGRRRVDRLTPAQPWPRRATVCFLAGVTLTAVALLGPPGTFDDTFFYAHMTQHILLTMVAAPLFVLGDPVLLVLRVSSRSVRARYLVPVLRSRAVALLVHPLVGWLLFVVVMVVSHVPAVYDFALEHAVVHDVAEHPVYLLAATVFYYPLLATNTGTRHVPEALRVLSLLTVMVPMALIGFAVYVDPHVTYPFYAHVDRPFGPGPLADQQLAGALMWSSSMVLSAGWTCLGGLAWLRSEERRGRRVDRAAARLATPPHESPA